MPAPSMPKSAKHTKDHHQDIALDDTFPASDPVGSATTAGARAVDVNDMQAAVCATPDDHAILEQRFADAETAKIALEGLVREGPVDRRSADIVEDEAGTVLRLRADPADAERLRRLLARAAA